MFVDFTYINKCIVVYSYVFPQPLFCSTIKETGFFTGFFWLHIIIAEIFRQRILLR